MEKPNAPSPEDKPAGRDHKPDDIDSGDGGPSPSELLGEAPPEIRGMIQALMVRSSRPGNPLLEKFNEGHIDKVLGQAELEAKNEYGKFRWNIFIFISCLGFLVFCIVFLKDEPDLLKMVISGVLGFLAGGGLGYGIGKHK